MTDEVVFRLDANTTYEIEWSSGVPDGFIKFGKDGQSSITVSTELPLGQMFARAIRDIKQCDALDKSFENEARLNPEPARFLPVTSMSYRCVHCLYVGIFHSIPPHLIRCPMCQCLGRKEAFGQPFINVEKII